MNIPYKTGKGSKKSAFTQIQGLIRKEKGVHNLLCSRMFIPVPLSITVSLGQCLFWFLPFMKDLPILVIF